MIMHFPCVLLFLSCLSFGVAKYCAHFEFPTLQGLTVTAEENTTVRVLFRLDTSSCPTHDVFSIGISRIHRDRQILSDYCKINRRNGDCHPAGRECGCLDIDGFYYFTKTVDRHDNGIWYWWTSHSLAENTELTFEITYPACIRSLIVSGNISLPFERGETVDVVCSWENGNPPVTARLLDRHGVEMEGSINSSGQIRYRFPAVGCRDAGLIRCEAPGASHNKTAMLLVKCPPQFPDMGQHIVKVMYGMGAVMRLPVRTHTTRIVSCTMRKLTGAGDDAGNIIISCSGTLTGTPPDLTLTVRLENVRKEEVGQWRLELTNDAGTGHVDFVLERTVRPEIITTTERSISFSLTESSVENVSVIGEVIGSVNLATAILVGIVLLCVWRRRRQRQIDSGTGQEMALPLVSLRRRNPDANSPAEVSRRADGSLPQAQGYSRLCNALPDCACDHLNPEQGRK